MPTRFVYFDLGKVIFNFDHRQGSQQVVERFGGELDEVHAAVFESGLEEQYESGLVSAAEFCNQVREATGIVADDKSLLNAISDIFTPNQPVFPIIAQLAAVGFPTGILSNTCDAHWELIESKYTFLMECFLNRVLSYEVQAMKPDARIYKHALREAQAFVACEPNEVFFVDDRGENVQGALDCGWDAILYESADQLLSQLDKRGVRINL